MTGAGRCDPELLALQAVRLAGVAGEDAVLDRTFLPEELIAEVIERAASVGWLTRVSFADLSGWTLTDTGSAHLADLLAKEVDSAGAGTCLTATLTDFDPVNARFVALVAGWQLRSTQPDQVVASREQATAAELLTQLTALGRDVRTVLAELLTVLPRFGRYPAQYDVALAKARTEGLGWVTGVGMLSSHIVWAELHQDLLATAGRERLDSAPASQE